MIIGITGLSGSGKTRFSKELRSTVNDSVLLVSQDSYYAPQIIGNPDNYNFDSLDALDMDMLVKDIKLLKDNKPIQLPLYDFVTHKRTGEQKVFPREVILLEGHMIFLEPRLRELIDLLIFVDLKEDLALIRRLKRDMTHRGRTVESVVGRHENFVRSINHEILKVKEFSDIIIPNFKNMDKATEVISSYINSLLKK